MENNTNVNPRKSRAGNANPFYGHHHSDSSKQKISDSQKQRYQQYKKAIDDIPHITMAQLLGSKPMREYINHLVSQQIDEMIRKKKAQFL